MIANREELKESIKRLPQEPGVYRYFNIDDELIYVGKAKNLKKRVSSYFTNKQALERKTRRLVSLINRLEFTVVNTEYDALLLENSLIKQHQPRYNILLRDDKTYPFVVITKEHFPRVFATRRRAILGQYFGPYASVKMINTMLELLKKLFQIRNCRLPLTETSIADKKWKVCLEYHIGNCKGPCDGKESKAEYRTQIDAVASILKGNLTTPKNYFREQMMHYAGLMEYEKAQKAKEKLELIDSYQAKSLIVNTNLNDIDVFAIHSTEERAYINYFNVVYGSIVNVFNLDIRKKLNESDAEILASAAVNIREMFSSQNKEVISNIPWDIEIPNTNIVVPQIGDKKKLVDLAMKNAMFYRKERMQEKTPQQKPSMRVLLQLKADLKLKELPDHIECFDNSNIQGTSAVAAMVCFKNGAPSKKDYRHYNIQTVVGPDDFASMREIVGRRYKRVLEEELPLPKLIVIDGGKGQLSAAVEALRELDLYGKIPILGIAKRLEELYYPDDPLPLYINKKSESLKLLQRLRDEAHRFGITHHRNKRSKGALHSTITDLPGFGDATLAKIMKQFRAVSKLNEGDRPALQAIIGERRTDTLLQHLAEKRKGKVSGNEE
jgi:excinuclease ABC subunit C